MQRAEICNEPSSDERVQALCKMPPGLDGQGLNQVRLQILNIFDPD